MATIISIANQKGGTGKTTTAVNLGDALAAQGKRTLLVDFDPQAALTLSHGIDPSSLHKTIYHALADLHCDVQSVIVHTKDGPDIAPANIDLSGVEAEMGGEPGRDSLLKIALEPICNLYDYVIIDCPPTLGLLTINALSASRYLLIPVQTEYYALKAIDLLLSIFAKVKARVNREITIMGFLPTMYQTNTIHSREVLHILRQTYGDQVLDVVIEKTVKFPDSVIVEEFEGDPAPASILRYDPYSKYADSYRKLAQLVMERQYA
jgi:chromosome partitioning protein